MSLSTHFISGSLVRHIFRSHSGTDAIVSYVPLTKISKEEIYMSEHKLQKEGQSQPHQFYGDQDGVKAKIWRERGTAADAKTHGLIWEAIVEVKSRLGSAWPLPERARQSLWMT